MKLVSGRFQFSLARLLACTTFVALAAWVSTAELPISLTFGLPAAQSWNVIPFLLCGSLLAAAIGVLVKGKPGAIEGARTGLFCLWVLSLVVFPLSFILRWIISALARAWS